MDYLSTSKCFHITLKYQTDAAIGRLFQASFSSLVRWTSQLRWVVEFQNKSLQRKEKYQMVQKHDKVFWLVTRINWKKKITVLDSPEDTHSAGPHRCVNKEMESNQSVAGRWGITVELGDNWHCDVDPLLCGPLFYSGPGWQLLGVIQAIRCPLSLYLRSLKSGHILQSAALKQTLIFSCKDGSIFHAAEA